jgi:hypothetical protein
MIGMLFHKNVTQKNSWAEPSPFCSQYSTYSFFIHTSALEVGSQTKENIQVNCAVNLLAV